MANVATDPGLKEIRAMVVDNRNARRKPARKNNK
jgi:hypothetical protein